MINIKRNRLAGDYQNVDKDDYIAVKYKDNATLYKYRTSCISCGVDKGYTVLAYKDKVCRSCSNLNKYKVESRPGLDASNFIYKDSRRHYKMSCIDCNADRGFQRASGYKSGLCRSCVSSKTHSGKVTPEETKQKLRVPKNYKNGKHPWLGRSHSESTKNQIREKQIEFCKENGNQFQGKSHSDETIEKISKSNSGKAPRWKGRVFQYSGPNGEIKMRSSYELFYANWMDSNDIQWEYEPLFRLSTGLYFSPDFKVNSHDIIEIKGYWTEKAKNKWSTFCKDYPEIDKKILMKKDLVELGMNK